jgi:hypothetical protein
MKQLELDMTLNAELKIVGALMLLVGVNIIIGWGI